MNMCLKTLRKQELTATWNGICESKPWKKIIKIGFDFFFKSQHAINIYNLYVKLMIG